MNTARPDPPAGPPAPTVSVVIPTYNQPALLAEAVASALAQTLADLEVVVVDDGSTDDTPARLAALAAADPRVRVVRQPNAGTGAARNRGVREARGRYVALMDHDDLWLPTKLAEQVAYLDARPDCVAVACPLGLTGDPAAVLFDRRSLGVGPDGVIDRPARKAADGSLLFMTCTAWAFRRSAADGPGAATFGERRGEIEDVSFYIKLLARGRVGIVGDEPLALYRVHAANSSAAAAYLGRGVVGLRAMWRAGAFAGLSAPDRRDAAAWVAALGRSAAATALARGAWAEAAGVYLREWPHQVRHGRARFLLGMPALLAAAPFGFRRGARPRRVPG
jgi:glycosyltransferase involved in cell wall biosynthesis